MTEFLDRLKQKNEQAANILIKVHVNEVMVYGAPIALMMQLTENNIDVRAIPTTAYVFVRPEILEDHHIFRVIWRKDGREFSKGWIEKEVNPVVGSNGVPFHGFINGAYVMKAPEPKPEIYLGHEKKERVERSVAEVVDINAGKPDEPGAA